MRGPIRVLHVDDDPDFADITAELLARQSDGQLEVVTESDPSVVLERLERDGFDCVVSDFDMPGLNGLSLLERVRERYPHKPFILFTGKGSEEIASEAISAGVTDYLQKGGIETYDILANRIDNAVRQSELQEFKAVMKHDPLNLLDRFSDPLYALDTAWCFTYVNEATAEMFDQPRDSLIGESIWELFPEATETPFYDHYHAVLESGEPRTIEERFDPWDTVYREHLYPAEDGLTVVSYDITEEYHRKQELERTRELLRNTEELIDVGGWEFDLTAEELVWTSGTYRIHGLEPNGSFEPSLEAGFEYYHEGDRDTIQMAVDRCLESGEPYDLELRLRRDDGDIRWVHTTGHPVVEDDTIVGAMGAIHDITERRNREAQLLELSEFREAIIQSANVWINVLDADGTVVLWNAAAEEISGYSAEEVLGEDVWAKLYPDESYRREILKDVEAILEGESSVEEYETVIETKDGKERSISWYSHVITDEDGRTFGSVAIGRDITERQDHAREIERLQQLYAEAERLGNLGAWEFTEDGRITWTDGTIRIHEASDVPATVEEGIEYVHPDDRDRLQQAVEAALGEGEPYDIECRLVTATGSQRWVRIKGGPVDAGVIRGFIQDITETRERERDLEKTNAQLEAAVDAGNVGTWDWHVEADELFVDHSLAGTFGLDASATTAGHGIEQFLDAIHPDDRAMVETKIEEALEACAQYRAEYRVFDGDDEQRWVVARGQVECDENGTPVRFPGAIIDITDRKRREAAIAEMQQWYETILRHSSDYVVIVDGDGQITYTSPSLERIMGYVPDEVVGESAFSFVHDDDAEVAAEAFTETLTNPDEEISVEYRSQAADGSVRWIEARGKNYLDDPRIAGILVNVRVIDQRKREEQALERTNTILKAVMENHTAGILVEDDEREVLVANSTLGNVLGLDTDPEALVGRDCARVAREIIDIFANPTDVLETIEQRIEARTPIYGDHIELADGREIERDYIPVVLGDEAASLWIFRDITDRRAHEEALQRQVDRLDEFASVVSHDLRSPLMVATGRLELLDETVDSPHIEAIDTSLERMETLIEDLLELARAGNRIGEVEAVDLAEVAQESWRTVDTEAAELTIATLDHIDADRSRLRQLLENLFRDAIEHAGADVSVEVGPLPDGFFVEDDGPGIPAEAIDEIFDAGYSSKEDGTGFGLSIVHAIAEAHGWHIEATSGEHGGARFEFTDVQSPTRSTG